MSSINSKLATILLHALLSAILALGVSWAGYVTLLNALQNDQMDQAQAYINVKAANQQDLFNDARQLNDAALQVFRRRYSLLENLDVSAEFDEHFPIQPDGTRRSAPELFEGVTLPDGDHVFGVGAYMGNGSEMTMEDKRTFLAAFHTVHSVGEAYLGQFNNLYFYDDNRRLVIFAPDREDRLEFYRFNAPADFDMGGNEEDTELFGETSNPDRVMQCTRLARLVYEEGGLGSMSACRRPLWSNDQLTGVFGTSIMMTPYLVGALENPPAHGTNMLFNRDGQLISRGFQHEADLHEGGQDTIVNSAGIMSLIETDSQDFGVIRDPSSSHLIAYVRLDSPKWFFVTIISEEDNIETAQLWSKILFLIVLFSTFIVASVRWLLSRMRPLGELGFESEDPRIIPAETDPRA